MIAASALSTDCSAQVMSVNGMAMLMTAMTSRWPYIRAIARAGACRPAAATIHRNAAPMSSRRVMRVNVPNESTASLMNR